MILTNTQSALLVLLQQALWGEAAPLAAADWQQVTELASAQAVLPMLYRGAIRFKETIPQEHVLTWRKAMYGAVFQNDQINAAQIEILGWFEAQQIRTVVLKGTSVAQYYVPHDMRYLGDVDLLIDPGSLEEATAVLQSHGYRLMEHEHGFHVSFTRKGITVEVHYAPSLPPHGACRHRVEEAMNRFLDDVSVASMNDMHFPVLSGPNQALMLLLHMERHMMVGSIGLRQLCDWAVYVRAMDPQEWISQTAPLLKECGLYHYACILTRACSMYLGLPAESTQWNRTADEGIAQELMYDVFRGGNMGHADDESIGNIFSNRNMLGTNHQTRLTGLITYLNGLAYKNFPAAKKHKVLLPLLWIYLPLRYGVRVMLGLRPRKNVKRILSGASRQQKLHKALRLYEAPQDASDM